MVYRLIALITLNVTINSYGHALSTLFVSNPSVEIKGSVFEKDNCFRLHVGVRTLSN